MKKQVLFFLLVLMPMMASAETIYIINGIWYKLNSTYKVAVVTSVPYGAADNAEYSNSVVIPKTVTNGGVTYSVTSIGDQAFSNCSGLTSVTIPNSVKSIGTQAFYECSGLTSLTIPNSVTSIGLSAFSGCSDLTSVTIPNSVTYIGVEAFYGCTSIEKVTFHCQEIDSWFNSIKSIKEVIIGDEVKSIGNSAFSGCSGLTSITIPNSVVSIGYGAFSGCSGLTSITVENGNTMYDSRNNCNAIIKTSTNELISGCKSTIIPNSITSIGSYSFSGCSGLTSITIPNSVVSIGYGAFFGCSGLTSITVENGNTMYDSRNNCNAIVKTSTNELIRGCKSTIIPNSITSIGSGAFCGSGLTSVTIPGSVTSIGDGAFEDCSSLTSIDIPNSVTNIENWAFYGCSALTEVRCFAEEVPSTAYTVFDGCPLYKCTLYVPKGSLNSYKSTSPWSEFGNIVCLSNAPVYELTYIIDGQIYKSYEYEEGENVVPEPVPTKEGYYFSGWSEIPETMPAHNVTVTGSFMQPSKCETPVITFLANGKIKVECATEGATCVTNISASNAEPLKDGEISLNTPLTVYTVTSYATKEGYNDSEVATATFRYEKTEGDMNGDGMLNITDVIHLVNMILGQ